MKLKTFQIRNDLLLSDKGKSYKFLSAVKSPTSYFTIPKNQIIKINKQKHWISISVTEWLWCRNHFNKDIYFLKAEEKVKIENETHFGIDWNYVIKKRSIRDNCFFCHRKLYRGHITKDHLVAKAILGAYGYKHLPNNLVPCCPTCNKKKANLHPEIFKELVKRKLHQTGQEYYRIILDTLNRLLIKN